MQSLAKHRGQSSEGRRVRFLGYGPGCFFVEDVADGSGTSLSFLTEFDDDDGLGNSCSFRAMTGSVVLINTPSVDNGIIEVDNMRDDLDRDGDMG
jgi:hypothetical protein